MSGIFEKTIKTREARKQFERYVECVAAIVERYDPVALKEEIVYANQFENKTIIPTLDSKNKAKFREAKSVHKYVNLKVLGETLGNVLTKRRAECCCEMVKHSNLINIIEKADKKTIVFTSFVEALKVANEMVTKNGLSPILIYGETNKDVTRLIDDFKTNPGLNPLIATIKSLSVGQTLTQANVVVFLDYPFRVHEMEQAVARAFRIGQTATVYVYEFILDTVEPNISSRAEEIMLRWKTSVGEILGTPNIGHKEVDGIVHRLQLNNDPVDKAIRFFRNIFR